MPDRAQAIIIGSSGMVGTYFRQQRSSESWRGTFFTHPFDNGHLFDIRSDHLRAMVDVLPNATHVVLLAANTNIDYCANNPEETRDLNVASVCRLVDEAWELDLVPVYISSDAVYGDHGYFRDEGAAVRPESEYGHQKAAVEAHIINAERPGLVLRLAKVLGTNLGDRDVFHQWIEATSGERQIALAFDQHFTPIAGSDVAEFAWRLIENRSSGIYNIGGLERVSRLELFRIFEAELPADLRARIAMTTVSIRDLPVVEPRPHECSVAMAKTLRATRHVPMPLSEICAAYLAAKGICRASEGLQAQG